MNLFMVSSPLQFINALEAKHYFNYFSENCILLIFQDSGKNRHTIHRIKNMIKETDWYKVYYIGGGSSKTSWIRSLTQLSRIKKYIFSVKDIFVGDFLVHELMKDFINNINYDNVYLLDDGNKTLTYHELSAGNDVSIKETSIKDFVRNIIKKYFFRFSVNYPYIFKKLNYFTIYNLRQKNNEIIIKNDYQHIKRLIDNKDSLERVWFLGCDLPECNIVSEKIYLDYLEKIKNYFSPQEIIYIPHRFENMTKLKKIEQVIGIEIYNTQTCIEYELCQQKNLPNTLASFFCSALDTCNQIYRDKINIKSFIINPSYIDVKIKDHVQEIYSYYHKNYKDNFSIVDLANHI